MANASTTTLAPVLKTTFEKRAAVLAYDNHPLLGLVPKNENFKGKNFVQTVNFSQANGRSATFANAQANKTANAYRDFTITRVTDYGLGSIDGEALEAAEGEAFTMAEGLESEIAGMFTTIGISLAAALYRKKSGTIAQVGAYVAAALSFTLAQPLDVVHFAVGMTIGSSPTDGTGAQNVGAGVISAIDEDTGTIFSTVAWDAAIAGFAAADFLFVDGDYNAKISGLASWIPQTAPTAGDNFFGVDRSVMPTRLAGQRYDGLGGPKDQTLQKALSFGFVRGSMFTHLFANPDDVSDITIGLGSNKVQQLNEKAVGAPTIGYDGFLIVGTGNGRPIKVYPDPDCPKGQAWLLKLDTWELRTLGKAPRFLEYGALGDKAILRAANEDSVEYRTGYRGQLRCKEPLHNCHITWLPHSAPAQVGALSPQEGRGNQDGNQDASEAGHGVEGLHGQPARPHPLQRRRRAEPGSGERGGRVRLAHRYRRVSDQVQGELARKLRPFHREPLLGHRDRRAERRAHERAHGAR